MCQKQQYPAYSRCLYSDGVALYSGVCVDLDNLTIKMQLIHETKQGLRPVCRLLDSIHCRRCSIRNLQFSAQSENMERPNLKELTKRYSPELSARLGEVGIALVQASAPFPFKDRSLAESRLVEASSIIVFSSSAACLRLRYC